MRYLPIIISILLVMGSCKSGSVATSTSGAVTLDEVNSFRLDTRKIHHTCDTLFIEKGKFFDFYGVNGVAIGTENYENSRFYIDAIYSNIRIDSLKN